MTGHAVAEALGKLAPLVADMEPGDLEGLVGVASGWPTRGARSAGPWRNCSGK